MSPVHRVAGVVLAAGRGRRFGGTKQLAQLDGRALVAHAVGTAIEAGLAPVLVVVGHDADLVTDAVPDGATVVRNEDHAVGQSTSLRSAVHAATATDADAIVVLLADEPDVTVTAVDAVVAALAAGATAARAVYDDRPGHPVGLARPAWPRLLDVRGDRGARRLLDELAVTAVHVDGPAPVDVDTTDDLAALRDGRRGP